MLALCALLLGFARAFEIGLESGRDFTMKLLRSESAAAARLDPRPQTGLPSPTVPPSYAGPMVTVNAPLESGSYRSIV